MIRSILVPLDGSQFGEQALPLALSLARRLDASVQIVHVNEPAWAAYGLRPGLYETLEQRIREAGRTYLDKTVERFAPEAGISVNSVLLDGAVADAIDRHATTTEVDLIVVATHGRGRLARFWLGSVADSLIRQVKVPMLLVPPSEAPDATLNGVPRRVLIPLDGSELAEQILEPAVEIGKAAGAGFRLLRVIRPMLPPYPRVSPEVLGPELEQLKELHQAELADAKKYLQEIANRLQAQSLSVETEVVTHEQTGRAILDDASAHQVDMIALATQGYGGWKRLMLGSVADKVLRGTTIPVLVYRPQQAEEGGD